MLGGTLFQIKWNTVPCCMERCYRLDGTRQMVKKLMVNAF